MALATPRCKPGDSFRVRDSARTPRTVISPERRSERILRKGAHARRDPIQTHATIKIPKCFDNSTGELLNRHSLKSPHFPVPSISHFLLCVLSRWKEIVAEFEMYGNFSEMQRPSPRRHRRINRVPLLHLHLFQFRHPARAKSFRTAPNERINLEPGTNPIPERIRLCDEKKKQKASEKQTGRRGDVVAVVCVVRRCDVL